MKKARKKSSPSRMRFSRLVGGNLTELSARQLPLLVFTYVGDSLLKKSASDMAVRPKGGFTAVKGR